MNIFDQAKQKLEPSLTEILKKRNEEMVLVQKAKDKELSDHVKWVEKMDKRPLNVKKKNRIKGMLKILNGLPHIIHVVISVTVMDIISNLSQVMRELKNLIQPSKNWLLNLVNELHGIVSWIKNLNTNFKTPQKNENSHSIFDKFLYKFFDKQFTNVS